METINRESVRLILKNECKPWLKKMWCITRITPEYRRRMYRLLDLYEEDYEYTRNGTPKHFCRRQAKAGKRTVRVTKTRKKADFARFVADLVKTNYGAATEVRLVVDNLKHSFCEVVLRNISKTPGAGAIG